MPRSHRRGRSAWAALLLALALTGCSGEDKASETAIEEAAEQAGEDVDVDVDGDEITIESSDGAVTMGGDLPEGFPADDVPIVDGEILMAMGAEGQGYQVTVDVDDAAAQAMAAARDLLEGAGFTLDEEGVMDTLYTATLSSAAYNVFLTATEADGRTTLSYAIEVV